MNNHEYSCVVRSYCEWWAAVFSSHLWWWRVALKMWAGGWPKTVASHTFIVVLQPGICHTSILRVSFSVEDPPHHTPPSLFLPPYRTPSTRPASPGTKAKCECWLIFSSYICINTSSVISYFFPSFFCLGGLISPSGDISCLFLCPPPRSIHWCICLCIWAFTPPPSALELNIEGATMLHLFSCQSSLTGRWLEVAC